MTSEQLGQIMSIIIAVAGSVAGAKKLQAVAPPPASPNAVCPTCHRPLD